MIDLQVLLSSWLLLSSCICVAVLEIVLVIWIIAELRSRLHRLKLLKFYRQHEYELLTNRHIRLWRRIQKRPVFIGKLKGREKRR